MRQPILVRLALSMSLAALVSPLGLGQLGPPAGGNTTGSTSASSRTIPKGAVTPGIAAGTAGAVMAAGTILYFARHGRHRSYILGCVTPSSEGSKVMDEKDKKTYALLAGSGVAVSTGKRVKLYGKRVRGLDRPTFVVQALANDYGTCSQ